MLSFLSVAKDNMSILGYNYDRKMFDAKERVIEAKQEIKQIDFDLELFDFENDYFSCDRYKR